MRYKGEDAIKTVATQTDPKITGMSKDKMKPDIGSSRGSGSLGSQRGAAGGRGAR